MAEAAEAVAQDNTEAPAGAWIGPVPDDLSEAAKPWTDKTPADLLRAHVDLSSKAIVPPGEGAKPEEVQAFNARLREVMGVPETPEGYKIALPEGVPKGDPVFGAFIQASHEHGLNAAQLQGVMGKVLSSIAEHREGQALVSREAMQKHWGDDFEANTATAITGMEAVAAEAKFTVEETAELAAMIPLSPALAKAFHRVGLLYKEDATGGGKGKLDGGEMERTRGGMPQLDFPSMRK